MDIYILRDGKEIGPFTAETARTLVRQGSALVGDLAWRPGMPKWLPLAEVLPSAAVPQPQSPPPAPTPTAPHADVSAPSAPSATKEPATARQKALLTYLGIPFPAELAKDEAALLVNDAMEDPNNAGRLAQWTKERFHLHSELFAAEIQAKKENRAHHFCELCQTEGAEYFSRVTKAHAQVLIGYLDVKFPNWDAHEEDAAPNYFFPAIAEKFPQLVNRQWKGKLKYPGSSKVSGEITHRPPSTPLRTTNSSAFPLLAVARGVFFGVLILAVLWLARSAMTGGAKPQSDAGLAQTADATPPAKQLPVLPEKRVAKNNPKPVAPNDAAPGNAPEMAANTPAIPPAPQPADAPKPPDPNAPAPMAGQPAGNIPLFAPDKPATGTAPAGLPDALGAPGSAPVAAPAARTNLRLVKPIEIQLAYGKMKLPAGTAVKLVSQDGGVVKVSYLNSVITVPASSTDLNEATPAAPAPATSLPKPATDP